MIRAELVFRRGQHSPIQSFGADEIVAIGEQQSPIVECEREVGNSGGWICLEDRNCIAVHLRRIVETFLHVTQTRDVTQRQSHFLAALPI